MSNTGYKIVGPDLRSQFARPDFRKLTYTIGTHVDDPRAETGPSPSESTGIWCDKELAPLLDLLARVGPQTADLIGLEWNNAQRFIRPDSRLVQLGYEDADVLYSFAHHVILSACDVVADVTP